MLRSIATPLGFVARGKTQERYVCSVRASSVRHLHEKLPIQYQSSYWREQPRGTRHYSDHHSCLGKPLPTYSPASLQTSWKQNSNLPLPFIRVCLQCLLTWIAMWEQSKFYQKWKVGNRHWYVYNRLLHCNFLRKHFQPFSLNLVLPSVVKPSGAIAKRGTRHLT